MSNLPSREPPRWLSPLSAALAEALPRLYGEQQDPLLTELIDALTKALEQGEIAIHLGDRPPEGVNPLAWPDGHRGALERSLLAKDPHGPLVLDGPRVRWRRWHQLRQEVLDGLLARAQHQNPLQGWTPSPTLQDPQQRLAIRTALERNLLILAGGPGTGKTSTVAHILSAYRDHRESSSLHLAAPTGKAAARLREATGDQWPCSTLHQLLESRGDGEFRRHRQHPLKLDLLVVDEVSMVDLSLMGALLRALPAQAALVLVGDPAQLPPVAPGAPLQELLHGDGPQPLKGALVTLKTSYRNAGAIAAVASMLRERIQQRPMEAQTVAGPLQSSGWLPQVQALASEANLHWQSADPGRIPAVVRDALKKQLRQLEMASQGCAPGTDRGWEHLVRLRDTLLVLTPSHRGPWGVEAVHQDLLGEAARGTPSRMPSGTPVICTRNLHDLGLSNGDLGVVVAGLEPWLVFGQDRPIWVHPCQMMGALEPALTLTVHKAQGSEADQVMVLLPEPESVDLRLLYTALTRAREEAWLLTPQHPTTQPRGDRKVTP